MNTREELRTLFKNKTGTDWVNSQDEPDIEYVNWLEDLVLMVLPEQLKPAKTTAKIRCCVSCGNELKNADNNDCDYCSQVSG